MKPRYQKNITITKEQAAFAKANYGKMNNTELAKMLGIGYGKTLNNLIIMELYKPRYVNHRYEEKLPELFDVDAFGEYYDY